MVRREKASRRDRVDRLNFLAPTWTRTRDKKQQSRRCFPTPRPPTAFSLHSFLLVLLSSRLNTPLCRSASSHHVAVLIIFNNIFSIDIRCVPRRKTSPTTKPLHPSPRLPSCTNMFDKWAQCFALGPQLRAIYRYGGLQDCKSKLDDFKYCLTMKGMTQEERYEAWIRRRKRRRRRRRGWGKGSSENVWELRRDPREQVRSKGWCQRDDCLMQGRISGPNERVEVEGARGLPEM